MKDGLAGDLFDNEWMHGSTFTNWITCSHYTRLRL